APALRAPAFQLHLPCPLLAPLRHRAPRHLRLLMGAKRTFRIRVSRTGFDPRRTFSRDDIAGQRGFGLPLDWHAGLLAVQPLDDGDFVPSLNQTRRNVGPVGTPMVFMNYRPKMSDTQHFERFAEECERLAQKQVYPRDRKALLLMAKAWLLLAEHAFSSAEHQSRAH